MAAASARPDRRQTMRDIEWLMFNNIIFMFYIKFILCQRKRHKEIAMTDFTALSFEDRRLDSLRRRIGWLCQTLRFALVGYCLWILFTIATFWSDELLVVARFASLKVDVEGMAADQRLAAFGVSFVIWTLLVVACYSGWRLFSGYLEGRIFTPDAAGWLRSSCASGPHRGARRYRRATADVAHPHGA